MRTTLNLDDDIAGVARELAAERGVSMGKIVSELARRGLRPRENRSSERNGLPVFEVAENAQPITTEDVQRAEDEPQ